MSGLAAGGPGYADALETDANHAVRLQEWITSELRSQSQKFTEKHDIRVWTGTWNLNGKPPKNHAQHVREWLKPEEECDIYVLGFQEVMPLNPTNTLSVQSQALTGKWESIIDSVLNGKPLLEETMGKTEVEEWLAEAQGEQQPVATPEGGPGVRQLPQDVPEEEGYVQIGSKQLVGIYLTVWMKASLWSHTNHIEVLTIGCGALGFLGNKGAVCLRFSLYNTSLCFVCAHLSSGESHGTERRRDAEVADILDRAVFSDVDISTWTFSELLAGPVPTTILAHDVAIWIGDLNYRIDLDNLVIHEAIGRRDWEFLFEAEQLQVQKAAGMVFQGWNEGPIDFQPTYRFRIGQDTYCGDGTGPEGEKKRRPAWCDRILYRGREIEQLTYSMTDVRSSDHRPVSSVFLASLKEIIPHKLEDVRHELRRKLDHYEMTIQPQCSVEPVLVEIGNVRFEEPNVGKVTVKNIGDVLAKIQFLNFPGTERICPSWIRVSPTGCAVDMGCSQDINLTVMVESAEESQQLYEQNGMIDEVLVLHIEGGRDFFVRVQGTFELTCFGLSIEKQLDLAQPVRSRGPAPLIDLAPTTRTIPHAMDELTAWLLQMERLREPDLFLGQEEGSGVGGISTIRDLLDEGETLPTDTAPGEALASLIHWLECLPTPLIPTTALYRWGNGGKGFMEKAVHFLQQEVPVRHFPVVAYLISFMRELISQQAAGEGSSEAHIVSLFSCAMCQRAGGEGYVKALLDSSISCSLPGKLVDLLG